MTDKNFKVKNGLIVNDSASIGGVLTVTGNSVLTGNLTVQGTSNFQSLSGNYAGFDSDFNAKDTGALSEGSNLYYTTSRVDSAIDVRVDSAYITLRTPEYIRETNTQTMTNKTIVDPIIDSTGLFGQQFGGLSVNVDTNLGDSTQSLFSMISKDSSMVSGIALGVRNQDVNVIATKETPGSTAHRLILGLQGNKGSVNIIKNIGSGPFNFDPATADDLVTINNNGDIETNSTKEASNQTQASIKTKGGIAAEKNIRGEDIIAANNIQAAGGELQGTLSAASLGTRSTTDLPEGTNLYYTNQRVDDYINASILTTDVSEGTNLYYTTARADSDAKNAVSVNDGGGDGSLSYNNSTGVISYVGPSPAEVRAHFSGGTGVTLNSGTGAISIGQPVGTGDSVEFNSMSINQNVVIYGNLTVQGTQDVQSQTELSVANAFIKVADSNSSDTVDIGIVGRYSKDGGTTIERTGFIRDATNGEWYVFDGLIQNGLDSGSPPYDQTININGPGYNQPTWNFGALRGRYLGFDSDFAAFSSNYTVNTTSFTAVNAGRYAIDTSGGSITVTLPANPQTGDYVRLIDVANFTNNSCIVNRNGSTIEGLSQNFELDLGQSIIEFIYINSNWQIYSSIGQRGPQGPKGDSADVATFASQAQSIAFSVALG